MMSAVRMIGIGLMLVAALLWGEAMARPPLFSINPIADQSAAATFQYQVRFTVEDEACWIASISFDLMTSPAGMTITNGGKITWTLSASQTSDSYQVMVHATAPTPLGNPCYGSPAQDFESFVITATDAPSRDDSISLNVLTYNIFMRPTSLFNDDQDLRALLIPTQMRGYDLIVFQEAFSDSHREYIVAALAAEYPYHTRVLGKDRFVEQDGGVMIISKWPIARQFQTHFEGLCSGSDCLSDKGVLYARLNVKGKPIHIFGTHTQADDDQRPTREAQLRIIRSLIDRMAIPADQAVLIAGDLNVDLYTVDEYTTMLSILSATHPAPQSGARGFTSHPANDYVDDNSRAKYLDYVLYSSDHLKPDPTSNDVRIFRVNDWDLSDHYPVEGSFSFSDIGGEPLGTFPFAVFFEGNSAQQDYVCNVSMEREKTLNFKQHRECVNDEVRSLILYDIPTGRVLRLFDSPDGSDGDDWVEIVVKRKVSKKQIDTFERSFEDDDVRVTYYSDNGLDGKVSRLEVACAGGDCDPPDSNRLSMIETRK